MTDKDTVDNKTDQSAGPKKKNHLNTIIIIVAVGLSIWGYDYWDDNYKDKYFPRALGVVSEGEIYRSGIIHENLYEDVLLDNNIKVIVNLTGEMDLEYELGAKHGIEVKFYRLEGDGTGDLENYIKAVVAVIEAKKQGKPVLVHCTAGRQRTGGTVLFYRMLVNGNRDNRAMIRELKKYGWKTKDTTLINYVNENMLTMAQRLKKLGLIAEIPNPVPQVKSKGAKTYFPKEKQPI
jgi:protein tyrosine phosphatase